MKFTLVEKQESRLRSMPDLGIGYLIAECRAAGVNTSLVLGSPTTLQCLRDREAFSLFLKGYSGVVKERGEEWLRWFLDFNYQIATSTSIADKANPEAVADLWELLSFVEKEVWPEWLPRYLISEIESTNPDVVGFSVWDPYGHPEVVRVLQSVVKTLKQDLDIPIIFGGPGVLTPTSRSYVMRLFNPDFIIHHEGERALLGLLDMIETSQIKPLPNLSYPGYDGPVEPIKDLDSLQIPDFSDYDLDSFFPPVRVLPAITSRGCEWSRCAFCSHHNTYSGYHEYSGRRLREIIETYKDKYRTDLIMLQDETMTARRARVLVKELPNAYYYSYAYPKGFDKDLLKRMHAKGFRVLVWGVESGSQRILNLMRKGTNIREVEAIIRNSYEVGITNVAFIMFGFPGETREEAEETVEFLKRNARYIERHAATQFYLAEGSPIWEQPELWGVKKTSHGYSVTSGMGRKEVQKFLKDLNRLRPKTSADTKYYFPGDSELRAYFFVQVVYGEGEGSYPVRTGILLGDEIWPSLLMKNVSRPRVKLSRGDAERYAKCDGRHRVEARDFLPYPYVVFYRRPFFR